MLICVPNYMLVELNNNKKTNYLRSFWRIEYAARRPLGYGQFAFSGRRRTIFAKQRGQIIAKLETVRQIMRAEQQPRQVFVFNHLGSPIGAPHFGNGLNEFSSLKKM